MSTLYSIVQDDIQDVLIQFSITPRDISSVPVHPISEGTNLKIGKCYSDIPCHSRGVEVSQLVIHKLCKYEIMSSLITSRINSLDIILEFQIPVLPHRVAITRFVPARLIITEQTWCPGNSDFTLNDGQRSQQYSDDSKAGDQNSSTQFRNRFLLLTAAHLWSGPGPWLYNYYITGPDVCPLLVSPRNCLAPAGLSLSEPRDRDRCRSRQPRRRYRRPGNNGRPERERERGLSWDCEDPDVTWRQRPIIIGDIVNVA